MSRLTPLASVAELHPLDGVPVAGVLMEHTHTKDCLERSSLAPTTRSSSAPTVFTVPDTVT
jgi:hypothetical protein